MRASTFAKAMADRTADRPQSVVHRRMTRNGKIARLPAAVRARLNQRLADNEPGVHLVAWLNGLPEVQAILAADFNGVPVSSADLTEWKAGGFCDGQTRQDALRLAHDLDDPTAPGAAARGLGILPKSRRPDASARGSRAFAAPERLRPRRRARCPGRELDLAATSFANQGLSTTGRGAAGVGRVRPSPHRLAPRTCAKPPARVPRPPMPGKVDRL